MRSLALGPLCAGLALTLLASQALAQVPGEPLPTEQEISESQQRLEQIRRERAELRAEMTRIRARVSDLSSEVTNIGRQTEASSELLEELDFQIAQREEQITANTTQLLITRDQLAERRAVLHRRLRDIYKRGSLQTLEVLLTAESFSDLINRYKYLYLVAHHDRQLAEEVARLESQLVGRERALRTNLTQLETVRRERSLEFGQLSSLQDQQSLALTNVQSRERTTAERIEQLERDEARLGELLATLESRRRAAEAAAAGAATTVDPGAAPAAATITSSSMGSLAWPVEGPVVYRFGRAPQPNGTVVRWNGVGIGAPAGAAVRSVEGGTVVLAGPFEGYGPTVVLSHGGGFYTLYLYLRDIGVREGESVGRGQVLGSVGGESTSEGPHIEFQIRAPGGQAVDPIAWLQRR
ncbi:MAG: peptidoglycan DD-metalloendopeptidase family protein [Gemmatimonadota bacterium]